MNNYNEESNCVICYTDIENIDDLVTTSCGHHFCVECFFEIVLSLRKNLSERGFRCPVDRWITELSILYKQKIEVYLKKTIVNVEETLQKKIPKKIQDMKLVFNQSKNLTKQNHDGFINLLRCIEKEVKFSDEITWPRNVDDFVSKARLMKEQYDNSISDINISITTDEIFEQIDKYLYWKYTKSNNLVLKNLITLIGDCKRLRNNILWIHDHCQYRSEMRETSINNIISISEKGRSHSYIIEFIPTQIKLFDEDDILSSEILELKSGNYVRIDTLT